MISKQEPVYKDKFYCKGCKHAYEIHTMECQVCGYNLSAVFKVDERYSDLVQFRALRSMRRYNVKMGNV